MDEKDRLLQEYIETNDQSLRAAVIEKHLYVAEILAKKFVNRGVDYDDLFQVASLALILALDRYDPTQNVKFISFATPTIIGEIKRYFRDKVGIIKTQRRIYENNHKIKRAISDLSQIKQKEPSVKDIAQYTKLDEETVLEVLEYNSNMNVKSLEDTIGNEEDGFFQDMVGIEDNNFEIAEKLHVSQMYISRMEKKILQRLRVLYEKQ